MPNQGGHGKELHGLPLVAHADLAVTGNSSPIHLKEMGNSSTTSGERCSLAGRLSVKRAVHRRNTHTHVGSFLYRSPQELKKKLFLSFSPENLKES